MPAISTKGDTVMSPDGTGRDCARPIETAVDECNSSNVFVNSKLVVVQGNKIAPHNKGGCDPDESVLSTFSPNVFIGNRNLGRIGDQYGDNTITQGSPNVFAN